MVKQRFDFDYRGQKWTPDKVKEAIEVAVRELTTKSYYAPIMKRFPLRIDGKVNPMAQKNLRDKGAPACTDGQYVYLLTDIVCDLVNEAIDVAKKEGKDDYNLRYMGNLVDNVRTIIAHEYIHILCQHHRLGQYYVNATPMEQKCHVIACEIEANRGDMINHDSLTYQYAVTEDAYPETKEDRYYAEIYATLLKNYKEKAKQMAKDFEKVKDAFANAEANGNKFKNGGQEGKQGKGNVQKEGSGRGSDNNQGQENLSSQDYNKGQNSEQDSARDSGRGNTHVLTEKEIEESIKRANEATAQVEKEVKDGGLAGATGLDSPNITYKGDKPFQETVKQDYERWKEKEVKKELKKLKGLIRGDLSKQKEKTYARPSRMTIPGSSLIRKGVKYQKSYSPKVLIALDSSGSMSSTTMKQVACAIENIFKDLGKPKTGSYICMHESTVTDVTPMANWKKVVEKYKPCGGNCFTHLVTKANELDVDVVINVGDGLDCVVRDYYGKEPIDEFNAHNRKWFDVLVANSSYVENYLAETEHDENYGFHREKIDLGDNITQYLKH